MQHGRGSSRRASTRALRLLCSAVCWSASCGKLTPEKKPEHSRLSEAALDELSEGAKDGNATVQVALGMYHYREATAKGAGSNAAQKDKDLANAALWVQKAAHQNLAEGQHSLAALYSKGHGVPQSHAKAREWMQRAADQGFVNAQSDLGTMFFKGEKGVPVDYTKAEHYLRMAVDEEHASAQLILAMVLIKRPKSGKAAKRKDHDEAKDLVYSAAADGVPGAQEALDTMKLGPRVGLGWKTKKKKKKAKQTKKAPEKARQEL